jgi:hypothetical protein
MAKLGSVRTIIYALVFGALTGFILTFAAAVFIPKFSPEWAGGFVCPGKVEYVTFKQTYICVTGANASFDVGSAMFWAVFWRALLPGIIVGILLVFSFVQTAKFLWRRRAAAGF